MHNLRNIYTPGQGTSEIRRLAFARAISRIRVQ